MTGLHRTALVALVATAGALAICMALPSFDPSCAMAPDARAMGACAAAQAGSREVALLGLVIGAIVGVIVVASVAIQVVLHHRVSRRLRRQARPAVLADHQIGLVPGIGAALVAGIRRPRTYCSDDLVTRLDTDEIRAVLLHERHHELAHAPARLVVLSALAPFLGRTGPGSRWLDRQRAAIEIAADRHAIGNGTTRATLARAILKLRETPTQLSLAGFATAGDLRLRALLGEDVEPDAPTRARVVGAVVMAVAVALLCTVLSVF